MKVLPKGTSDGFSKLFSFLNIIPVASDAAVNSIEHYSKEFALDRKQAAIHNAIDRDMLDGVKRLEVQDFAAKHPNMPSPADFDAALKLMRLE